MSGRKTVTRRQFMAATALACSGLWLANNKIRPNILWLTMEDVCPDLGCYGDAVAHTPNIDAFAQQAVRYTHCFSVSGVCAPSRACLATGMYSNSIGCHHMRTRTKDFPWLPRPYEAAPPAYVKHFAEYLRAAGYYCSNNVKTDYQFGEPVSVWDECSQTAHWRNRTAGQPFFTVINHTACHESQIRMPLDKKAITDPAAIQLPPYYPDTPLVRKDYARYYDNINTVDAQIGVRLAELSEDGLEETTIVFIFGDNGRGLPRAKRWLYDSGLHVPLLIRWPGKFLPGTVSDRLVSFVDFAPTVLSLANAAVPKYMQGQAFLGAQEKPARRYIYAARDRMDETYDYIRAVRDERFKYVRNYQPEKPYCQNIEYMDQMPTMQEWRRLHAEGKLMGPQTLFFAESKPAEELYDVVNDPYEINNLAQDPSCKNDLLRLRKALEKWRKNIHDMGEIPEKEMVARMWPNGQQPQTALPSMHPVPGRYKTWPTVKLTCKTPGASIVYTDESKPEPHWHLFSKPIRLTCGLLRCKAIRYGYKESAEVKGQFEIESA